MSTNILADVRVQQPQPSDDQLLAEARCGDQRAFGDLCQRYTAMLKRRIFRIVRHREDTEDVLQETLLSAYRHLHMFRGACRFSSWIMRIGINTSLVLLRKRNTLSRITPAVIKDDSQTLEMWEFRDPRPDPEQSYIADQALVALRNAIWRLPPKMRTVMDLYYTKEHCLKDASSTLGITERAAKARMLRARRMLRGSLKRQQNPDAANHTRLERSPQAGRNCTSSQTGTGPGAQNHLTFRVSDRGALVQSEGPSPLSHFLKTFDGG